MRGEKPRRRKGIEKFWKENAPEGKKTYLFPVRLNLGDAVGGNN